MNKRDWEELRKEIVKSEDNMKFYQKLHDESDNESDRLKYIKDVQFWKGYLNAVNLMWVRAKTGYKNF